jgi:ATP-dependent protease ClpP protease subunit
MRSTTFLANTTLYLSSLESCEEPLIMARTPRKKAATPPAPTLTEKQQLELRKLRAEAERAELLLERDKRTDEESAASAEAHNTYTFYDEVGPESIKECLEALSAMARQEPRCEITLILNSPGGGVVDGLALYDYLMGLRKRGHKITIIALGEAASMGGVLLQAGNKRVVGRNFFMLMHQISYSCYGRSPEHRDEMKLVNMMESKLLKILARRSSMTVRDVRSSWERTNWWIDAKAAVELGFADEIQ